MKLLDPDPVLALFTPVIMVVIGTSIVLTFNQLVLMRELAPSANCASR